MARVPAEDVQVDGGTKGQRETTGTVLRGCDIQNCPVQTGTLDVGHTDVAAYEFKQDICSRKKVVGQKGKIILKKTSERSNG